MARPKGRAYCDTPGTYCDYDELSTRQDLTEDWKSKLKHITDCLRRLRNERISN